jgi:hypothetical protein
MASADYHKVADRWKHLKLDVALRLPTKRLLAYYKKYAHQWKRNYVCDCCGEWLWNVYRDRSGVYEKEFDAMVAYFESIREELNQREHVS